MKDAAKSQSQAYGLTPGFDHFIAANEYGFYCIPHSYRGREVPRVLRRGEVYEPATIRFMQRQVKSGDIVSGGAFVGDFFPALERALSTQALIHSFEPNPTSFLAAEYTIALNGLESVRMHPVAVGEKEDTLPLLIGRGKDGASLAAGAKLVGKETQGVTVDVPVKPLDDLVDDDRDVSILHLDIEGHEIPALRGGAELIRRCAPLILAEAGRPHRVRAIASVLDDLAPDAGYKHSGSIEKNAIFLATGKPGKTGIS